MSTIDSPVRPARRLPPLSSLRAALAIGLALLGWLLAGPSGAAAGLLAALVSLGLASALEPVTPRSPPIARASEARVVEPVWIRRSEVHRARAARRH